MRLHVTKLAVAKQHCAQSHATAAVLPSSGGAPHQLGAAKEGEADTLDILIGAGKRARTTDGGVDRRLPVILAIPPLVEVLGVGLQAARLHLSGHITDGALRQISSRFIWYVTTSLCQDVDSRLL